jgi:hypothetical protein
MPKYRITKSKIRRGMIKSGTVVSNLPNKSKKKRSTKNKMKGGMIRSGTVVSNLPKKGKKGKKSRVYNKSNKSKKYSKK